MKRMSLVQFSVFFADEVVIGIVLLHAQDIWFGLISSPDGVVSLTLGVLRILHVRDGQADGTDISWLGHCCDTLFKGSHEK